MRKRTLRPFSWFVTRTRVPNGSERCAAVNSDGSYASPLAVLLPTKPGPYHEAGPLSRRLAAPTGLACRTRGFVGSASGAGALAGSGAGISALRAARFGRGGVRGGPIGPEGEAMASGRAGWLPARGVGRRGPGWVTCAPAESAVVSRTVTVAAVSAAGREEGLRWRSKTRLPVGYKGERRGCGRRIDETPRFRRLVARP